MFDSVIRPSVAVQTKQVNKVDETFKDFSIYTLNALKDTIDPKLKIIEYEDDIEYVNNRKYKAKIYKTESGVHNIKLIIGLSRFIIDLTYVCKDNNINTDLMHIHNARDDGYIIEFRIVKGWDKYVIMFDNTANDFVIKSKYSDSLPPIPFNIDNLKYILELSQQK